MNGPRLQHGFTIGRHGWLVLAVALGLALGTQAAVAKECHQETPLPADVRLSAPGPEVPEAVARFAGIWTGISVGPGQCPRWGRLHPTARGGRQESRGGDAWRIFPGNHLNEP
jgi:hypothetical protein